MTTRLSRFISLLLCTASLGWAAGATTYQKLTLSDKFFCEGSTFADLNKDGHLDAIAGPYWYEGPDFKVRHEIFPAMPFDPLRYSDNFFAFAYDFNGDQWPDIMVIGFPGVDASWYENPGAAGGPWRRHVVYMPVDDESATFGDLFGTGQPVIVCASGGRWGYADMFSVKDPARPWVFHAISPVGKQNRFTHGLGFGDVNGDGRNDILVKDGWWEQPASLKDDPVWTFHPVAFSGEEGGAQMYVMDVNGDGLPDVITSHAAHHYGLSWFEQVRKDGAISFVEHPILSTKPEEKINGVQFSQLHAVVLADVDGDGLPDIVTGKRWWAHGPKNDPEPNAPGVIYAFLLRRGADHTVTFEPQMIDDASGVGVQLVAADVNGDGRPDFISANKAGTFIFLSQGAKAGK